MCGAVGFHVTSWVGCVTEAHVLSIEALIITCGCARLNSCASDGCVWQLGPGFLPRARLRSLRPIAEEYRHGHVPKCVNLVEASPMLRKGLSWFYRIQTMADIRIMQIEISGNQPRDSGGAPVLLVSISGIGCHDRPLEFLFEVRTQTRPPFAAFFPPLFLFFTYFRSHSIRSPGSRSRSMRCQCSCGFFFI